MVFCAVLDTSVLFPATLRDTLLRVAAQDLYRPIWSTDILEELRSGLLSTYPLNPPDVDRLIANMTDAFPDAAVAGYQAVIETLSIPDPDDRHVLAAAITASADIIVTSNLDDFGEMTERKYPVAVQTPDTFLLERFHEYPEAVLSALREQVRSYKRPPRTGEELLDRLSLPEFATAVKARGLSSP